MAHPSTPTMRIYAADGSCIRIMSGHGGMLLAEARRLLQYYSQSHHATLQGAYPGAREETIATREGVLA